MASTGWPTGVRQWLRNAARASGHRPIPAILCLAAQLLIFPVRSSAQGSAGVNGTVTDETGAVIAALSVVLPRDATVDLALVELHGAAREIERALGFRG